MAVIAPDIILVMDRSAAIGSTPLNRSQLSDRLAELGAAESRVTILSRDSGTSLVVDFGAFDSR